MCHVNYPAIAATVEETCAEFGVRYSHNATVLRGVALALSLAAPDGRSGARSSTRALTMPSKTRGR